jgi:hypothetical protein
MDGVMKTKSFKVFEKPVPKSPLFCNHIKPKPFVGVHQLY